MMFLNYEFDCEIVNIPRALTTHQALLHRQAVVVISGEEVQLGGGNVPLGAVHGGLGLQELSLGEVALLELQLLGGVALLGIEQVVFLHRQGSLGGGDGLVKLLEGQMKEEADGHRETE